MKFTLDNINQLDDFINRNEIETFRICGVGYGMVEYETEKDFMYEIGNIIGQYSGVSVDFIKYIDNTYEVQRTMREFDPSKHKINTVEKVIYLSVTIIK